MSVYDKVKKSANSHGESQYLEVPLRPSLGMVLEAASTTDVFRKDDALWEYFLPHDHDYGPNDEFFIADELVNDHGVQKAYALSVIADSWSNCLYGYSSWMENNKLRGIDKLHYLPDQCPAKGYPANKDEVTEQDKEYARCTIEPIKPFIPHTFAFHREATTIATRRMVYSPACYAHTAELSCIGFLEFTDTFDTRQLPFVPNFTKSSYYDDEERGTLLLAAMWRGMIRGMINETEFSDVAMPYHPNQQSVIMTNMVGRYHQMREKLGKYYDQFPFKSFTITAPEKRLYIETIDGRTNYEYQDKAKGTRFTSDGNLLLAGLDDSGLSQMLSKMYHAGVTEVSAEALS